MAYGSQSIVPSLQAIDGIRRPGVGGLWKEDSKTASADCKTIFKFRRHRIVVVSKLAKTVTGIPSKDDDEISDRQRRSSRNTASTSGRTLHADDTMDLRKGRGGSYRADERSRARNVSPDASWNYAFASSSTKTRLRPGNGNVSAPGRTCKPLFFTVAWISLSCTS